MNPNYFPMLDYFKMILEKVSFSADLFVFEFKKAGHILRPEDFTSLIEWAKSNFANRNDLHQLIKDILD